MQVSVERPHIEKFIADHLDHTNELVAEICKLAASFDRILEENQRLKAQRSQMIAIITKQRNRLADLGALHRPFRGGDVI